LPFVCCKAVADPRVATRRSATALRAVRGQPAAVTVWETGPGGRRQLPWQNSSVRRAVFSPDGQRIAGACDDRTVKCGTRPRAGAFALKGHGEIVRSVAFSGDGQQLASAGGIRQAGRGEVVGPGERLGSPLPYGAFAAGELYRRQRRRRRIVSGDGVPWGAAGEIKCGTRRQGGRAHSQGPPSWIVNIAVTPTDAALPL